VQTVSKISSKKVEFKQQLHALYLRLSVIVMMMTDQVDNDDNDDINRTEQRLAACSFGL